MKTRAVVRSRVPATCAAVAILIAFLQIGCNRGKEQPAQPIRIVSWGGQFQQDMARSWWQPAAAKCNLKLAPANWNGDYGALTARIEKSINDWDLVHVEAHYVKIPEAASLFTSFPRSID